MREAFGRVPFAVEDAGGKTVTKGLLGGGPVTLPAGIYAVSVAASERPIRIQGVRVSGDKTTRIALAKRGGQIEQRIEIRP